MIILIGAGVLLLGVLIGYYLRVIVALGKRRSIEIDIKQMPLAARHPCGTYTISTGETHTIGIGVQSEKS